MFELPAAMDCESRCEPDESKRALLSSCLSLADRAPDSRLPSGLGNLGKLWAPSPSISIACCPLIHTKPQPATCCPSCAACKRCNVHRDMPKKQHAMAHSAIQHDLKATWHTNGHITLRVLCWALPQHCAHTASDLQAQQALLGEKATDPTLLPLVLFMQPPLPPQQVQHNVPLQPCAP